MTNISALTLQDAMLQVGINYNNEVIADDKFHRFYVPGDKRGSKNGWYKVFSNAISIGAFGSWKTQEKYTWHSPDYEKLSPREKTFYQQQIEEAKAIADKELKKLKTRACERANAIWQHSSLAKDDHPYLSGKKVKSLAIRLHKDDSLIIPLQDNQDTIHSLQFIKPDGSKQFLRDGAIKGNYYEFGLDSPIVFICEGYATAATLWEATQALVVIAFNAGNLLAVTQAIRLKYPAKQIIICADNDQFNTNGNIGIKKATEAAKAVNGYLVKPEFKQLEAKPTDFNDLYLQEGLAIVQAQLTKAAPIISTSETGNIKLSQASLLLALTAEIELFRNEQKEAYATFKTNDHFETWPVDSKEFKEYLFQLYWGHYNKIIKSNALQDVINTLKGKAYFEEKTYPVFSRVGIEGNTLYLNLANDSWDTVTISAEGWQIVNPCPIKFKGHKNMQPLPKPVSNANIDKLWQYINIPPSARKLVIAWLIECLRPDTHFPILVLCGLQGSAKSSTQTILRSLIDPNTCNLRGAPKKTDDIVIAAANNWLVSFNNLSNLSAQQQDDLCCLATGGGFATRRLFTTCEEEIVEIKRPVILNSINNLITAQDLADRCIAIELPIINEVARKTDKELQEGFNKDYPNIFSGLLDALAGALKYLPHVTLKAKPRMADFALLGTALENVFDWPKGSFLQDYQQNHHESISQAMEHSPIAIALIQMMESRDYYNGSYGALYRLLFEQYKPEMGSWPKSPRGLSNILKRQIPALAIAGIAIEFESTRRRDGYYLSIRRLEKQVHQVHHVHNLNNDEPKTGIVKDSETYKFTASTPQVHSLMPDGSLLGEHSVHGELTKPYDNGVDREIIEI